MLSTLAVSFENLGDVSLEAALAAVALAGTVTVWLVDRLLFQRRRLAYRIQMDTPLHITPSTDLVDVELRRHGTLIRDASLVLLRVENVGGKDLEPRDIHHPLSFSFPGRTILGVEITKPDPEPLKDMLLSRLRSEDFIERDRIQLPKIAINRRNSFKLFVLLTGSGHGVQHSGFLAGGGRGGGVRRDNRVRGPLGRGLAYGAVSAVLVGLLVGFLLTTAPAAPDHCVAGRLEIVGSTGFEPALKELRGAYQSECSAFDLAIEIQINTTGSRTGSRSLHDRGTQGHDVDAVVAVSDGTADPDLRQLRGVPVGVLVFAVVVNQAAGISSLSTDQLRAVYAGEVTSWRQLGGNDRPIRMVSRIGPDSGSRRAFQGTALGRAELGITSDDCTTLDDPASAYHRCEVGSTRELLENVDRIDGAIGYAELGASRAYGNLRAVAIDGQLPQTSTVTGGTYRFCAVEYLYSYGRPPTDGSSAAAFVDYLDSDAARTILRNDGIIPAADLTEPPCG